MGPLNMHRYLRFKVFPWCFPRAKANRSFIFLFCSCITFIYHGEMCLNYMLWMIHTLNVTSPFGLCKLWCTFIRTVIRRPGQRGSFAWYPTDFISDDATSNLPRQLHFVHHKNYQIKVWRQRLYITAASKLVPCMPSQDFKRRFRLFWMCV